ncbi:MAG TPA: hypothetical protein VJR70_05275 [Stellaceae bacterium]|nr:hypothetical protein [Stellaceae bacterium]
MPSIALIITRPPAEAAESNPPSTSKPLFRGTGDKDYLCGHCGSVMAAGMAPGQFVIVDRATCSGCGAENEFPPELRP